MFLNGPYWLLLFSHRDKINPFIILQYDCSSKNPFDAPHSIEQRSAVSFVLVAA